MIYTPENSHDGKSRSLIGDTVFKRLFFHCHVSFREWHSHSFDQKIYLETQTIHIYLFIHILIQIYNGTCAAYGILKGLNMLHRQKTSSVNSMALKVSWESKVPPPPQSYLSKTPLKFSHHFTQASCATKLERILWQLSKSCDVEASEASVVLVLVVCFFWWVPFLMATVNLPPPERRV